MESETLKHLKEIFDLLIRTDNQFANHFGVKTPVRQEIWKLVKEYEAKIKHIEMIKPL